MHHHEDTKLAKTKSFVVGKTGQWHGWLRFQEKRDARIDSRKFWKWWPWVLLMVWLTAVRESVSAPYLNRENSFGIAAVHLGTSALRITEDYHYTTLTHYIFSCRKLLSPKYRCETGIHVYGTPTICQALNYTLHVKPNRGPWKGSQLDNVQQKYNIFKVNQSSSSVNCLCSGIIQSHFENNAKAVCMLMWTEVQQWLNEKKDYNISWFHSC